MNRSTRLILAVAAMAGGVFGQGNNSTVIILHGKVSLDDGSPPNKMVVIEQMCSDQLSPDNVAYSEKNGTFVWRRTYDPAESRVCNIRGVLQGFRSSSYTLPAMTVFTDPNLAPITLTAKGSNSQLDIIAETTEGALFGGSEGTRKRPDPLGPCH